MVLLIDRLRLHAEDEGGPEDPKEQRSDHRHCVGVRIRLSLCPWFSLPAEDETHSQSEKGSESVNRCTSSSIEGLYLLKDHDLVERIEKSLKHCNDQHLFRADPSNERSSPDQHRCHAIGRLGEYYLLQGKIIIGVGKAKDELGPEPAKENIHLHDDGIDEEGIGERGERVSLDEGHQEAKADEHHDVDVLERSVPLLAERVWAEDRLHAHEDAVEEEDHCLEDEDEDGELAEGRVFGLRCSLVHWVLNLINYKADHIFECIKWITS